MPIISSSFLAFKADDYSFAAVQRKKLTLVFESLLVKESSILLLTVALL